MAVKHRFFTAFIVTLFAVIFWCFKRYPLLFNFVHILKQEMFLNPFGPKYSKKLCSRFFQVKNRNKSIMVTMSFLQVLSRFQMAYPKMDIYFCPNSKSQKYFWIFFHSLNIFFLNLLKENWAKFLEIIFH